MFWIIVIIIEVLIIIGYIIKNIKKNSKKVKVQAYQREMEARAIREKEEYEKIEQEILRKLGIGAWNEIPYFDSRIVVKSRQMLEKYDDIKFLKENKEKLTEIEATIRQKNAMDLKLRKLLKSSEYRSQPQYDRLKKEIETALKNICAYRIEVQYISPVGNNLGEREIAIDQKCIDKFRNDPSLFMEKGEYNKFLKAQQKAALEKRQQEYYKIVNGIIEYANNKRDFLIIKGARERLDDLVGQLFDRTVNSIKKIKTTDSEEWDIITNDTHLLRIKIEQLVSTNQQILAYYDSPDFAKIKETCEVLMSTQREFNEYINEKVQSISRLFGTRVVRTETIYADEYNYIRPYKKTITPFTAEVSATVFASAENNPLEYIVKYFYPYKSSYPEQIQKLYQLVEELETLRDAKQIIENYKAEYQQYLGDVPGFIIKNDEAGFYSRLGFANIDESAFAVVYKFAYTSGGGMAQRSFTVPMTEETIAELIKVLESKLTASAFAKEQRTLMTKKLREHIKERDNYTCCNCGNSTHAEPNLLLEIDHIIPVSKGGRTEESNLQTLCWKCNRAKSNKIVS